MSATGTWVKVVAGYYVMTTDDGHTAVVRKGHDEDGVYWRAEVTLPSGEVRTHHQWYDFESMAYAREWAINQTRDIRNFFPTSKNDTKAEDK